MLPFLSPRFFLPLVLPPPHVLPLCLTPPPPVFAPQHFHPLMAFLDLSQAVV